MTDRNETERKWKWLPWREGDHVKIFHDPLTEESVEADGYIWDIVRLPNEDGIGRYKVKFEDDSRILVRSIKSFYTREVK